MVLPDQVYHEPRRQYRKQQQLWIKITSKKPLTMNGKIQDVRWQIEGNLGV